MRLNALLLLLATVFVFGCKTKEPALAPIPPLPTPAQLDWHRAEMNAFLHFSINTFTDQEWGFGNESPGLFNPTALDTEQWISTLKAAGFRGVILTAKHHDGFCLWPSQYTEHSIKNSPYKNGKGDIVREVSDACRKHGLKFGIYVSPWDRNRADYGSPAYVEYYRNQLRELFTNYGPIFEMWFDGANGGDGWYGGANETRKIDGSTYYDWPTTLAIVREMEPDAIFFSDAGPGVRWVGNEKGIAGTTNWNMITPDTLYAGKAGIEELLSTGSENGTHWIPAEVDVSIRPGWFYHQREDSLVKSAQQLFDIYLTSVGRGSTLLLNVPPDKRGKIHERDSAALMEFKRLREDAFGSNLARGATINISGKPVDALNDGNAETFWAARDGSTDISIGIVFQEEVNISYAMLQEPITYGQRIKEFTIDVKTDGAWKSVALGTTVGHKRILGIQPTRTNEMRIAVRDARGAVMVSEVGVY